MKMLSERAEEILEALALAMEEKHSDRMEIGLIRDDPAIIELERLGLARHDQAFIYILEKGKAHAYSALRRHRLAERLLQDVFDLKKNTINEVSCKFEHLLHEGLEDSVCTMLGHPKFCPHGKSIPSGNCCKKGAEKKYLKFVSALSDLDIKDKGEVAYLQTKDTKQMQKLMSMGVLPGMPVILAQKFPSYVFTLGNTQFAVDKQLASAIYVRLK